MLNAFIWNEHLVLSVARGNAEENATSPIWSLSSHKIQSRGGRKKRRSPFVMLRLAQRERFCWVKLLKAALCLLLFICKGRRRNK